MNFYSKESGNSSYYPKLTVTYTVPAVTITSTASGGNWSSGSTWEGGVAPTSADLVEIVNGATVNLDGSVSRDSGTTLTVSGTLNCGNYTVSGAGDFELAAGGTLGIGSADGITSTGASGNIQVTGTRTFSANGNYTYNGSAAQVTGNGLPSSVNDLTLSNSAGLTLSATTTVNGTFTLNTGNLTTGGNVLAVSSSASVSRTSGHVIGSLQKNVATGASSRTFEIGDGSAYAPVSISFGNVTVAGALTASTSSGEHADIVNSGLDSTKGVNRYWTLTDSGITFDSYSATFTFAPADVDAGADTARFQVSKYSSGSWSLATIGTRTSTSTEATGLTSFSDFAVGQGATNHAPALTAISTLDGAVEDTAFTVTCASLAAAADEADADSDPLAFRVEAVSTGTLTKNGSPVVPGSTTLAEGEELVWTPAANANGSGLSAFTTVAYDGTDVSSPAVTVTVDVAAVNDTPTLTAVSTLTGGLEDTAYTISYASLAAAADEADVDLDTLSFRVEAVSSGSLTKNGSPVVSGSTTLSAGEELVWTPAASATGDLSAFTVVASDGAAVSSPAVQVTINVEIKPTVTFLSASQEVLEGVGTMTVTAQLSSTISQNVTVPFAITGTATGGGEDYNITASPLTITAGNFSATITITVVDDSVSEDDETVVLTMVAPTNATLGAIDIHTATIVDNDTPVLRSVQSGTATSSGNGTVSVSLDTAVDPDRAFLIFSTRHNSAVPGGSALRGRIATANTLEFVRVTGEYSTINIQWYVVEYRSGVRVQRGQVNEYAATFNVTLPTTLTAVNQAFATCSKTALASDGGFGVDDLVLAELTSTSNLQFRTATPNANHVIWWEVVEFLDPNAINVQKGSITTMTGSTTSATATLATPVDTGRTFVLAGYRSSGFGADIGKRMIRARLTAADTITVDRSVSGDNIEEIFWQAVELKDGSTVQHGTENFGSGVSQKSVNIDAVDLSRAAAFASVAAGAGLNVGRSPFGSDDIMGVGSATLALTSSSELTLQRNHTAAQADIGWFVVEFGPTVNFTTGSQSAAESAGTMTLTAQLSATTGQDVTVPFTVGGTATGGGTDYSLTASPVTVPAGSLSTDITITVVDDALDEDDETVVVTMGTPTNATQGTASVHTATISDNDSPPIVQFAASSSSGAESIGSAALTVSLSAASGKTVTVDYAVSGGTATGSGTDYTLAGGTLSFAAGETSAAISIAVVDDSAYEANETTEVTLSGPLNATLGSTAVHTFTILDNDANQAPVAGADSITRPSSSGVKVLVTSLLSNDSDAEGQSLSISAVSPASANGGSVSLSGSWIYYSPLPGFTEVDQFTYTLNDGHGGTDTGTVTINIQAASDSQTQNLSDTQDLGGGSVRVRFSGIPGRTYRIQFCTDLAPPANWQDLASVAADSKGQITYDDSPAGPSRFYRTAYP